MRFRLVCFDLDGVLTDHISSWVWVHDHFGVSNEVAYDAYMKEEIDDLEFMRRDIALWKRQMPGITMDDVEVILQKVPIVKGAHELMAELRDRGIMTGIVSGGIDILAGRIVRELGMDFFVANGLEAREDGRLTGEGISRVPLRDKGSLVKRAALEHGIPRNEIAAVGDTYIDIPMFDSCGYGIAFNPSDMRVQEAAKETVIEKDLSLLIPYLTV